MTYTTSTARAAWAATGTAALLALGGCAEPARFTVAEGSGNNPALPTPSRALIPTVNIAPARGWPADTLPTPARGLRVQAFARDLAASGMCVVSGLALGIDAAAHEGALRGGTTLPLATVAVVGTGVVGLELAQALHVSPQTIDLIDLRRANLAMRAAVAEEGVPLTGTDGLAWMHFLQRTWHELEEHYWEQQHAA